jgi:hypothetical protein
MTKKDFNNLLNRAPLYNSMFTYGAGFFSLAVSLSYGESVGLPILPSLRASEKK